MNDSIKISGILILFIWSINVKGQEIEKYIHTKPFTFSSASLYLNNHVFFNKAENQIWDLLPINQKIFKADLSLNIIDSVDLKNLLSISASDYLECFQLKPIDNELSLLLTQFYPDSTNFFGYLHKSHHVILDSNLGLVHHSIYDLESTGLQLVDVEVVGDKKFFVGWVATDSNSSSCIVSHPYNDSSYQISYYPDSLFSNPQVFANLSYLDSVFAVSLSSTYGSTTERIAIIDTSLKIQKLVDMYDPRGEPVYFPNFGFMVKRDNKLPIYISSVVGDYPFGQNQPYMLMGAGFMDAQYDFTRIDTFSFSGKHSKSPSGLINPKPWLEAFGCNTIDSCLLVMAGQEMLYGFGFPDKFANDVYFYNYNATLEGLNWTQVYNNGYTHASILSVTALPDNKYLVILNEYNWDKYSYDNLSIHLMIINGNGDLINQKENPHSRVPLSAYPNPFQDRVVIDNLPNDHKSYQYVLVTTSGQEVSRGEIRSTGEISFKEKHTGPHVLRVYSAQELIQSLLVIAK